MYEWEIELLHEYKIYRRQLKKQKDQLPADDPQHKIYNSMISDMTYTIGWLKKGHEPRIFNKAIYSKRKMEQGLEVKNRKEVIFTDDLATKAKHYDVIAGVNDVQERQLTIAEKKLIQSVLSSLPEKQMQCFVLNTAYNRSLKEIAIELGITKGAVQEHIESARKKVAQFQLERVAQ
ncbi:sigma factor-like helix-turn-helix DNA-binding protein [Ureibacillus endophyticus]|nr:sigma factor-like helix-turn-helix DNA-binding protein [Lysinibacillus endophyticus]